MAYSVSAACAACEAGQPPNWPQWAGDNSCGPSPGPFPSNLQVGQGTIPGWAYQSLPGWARTDGGKPEKFLVVQIVVQDDIPEFHGKNIAC